MRFTLQVLLPLLCGLCLETCRAESESDSQTAQIIAKDRGQIKANVPQRTSVPMERPIQPKMPDCFRFFPGTPGWNGCFQKFTEAMAEYQVKMHEYTQNNPEGADGDFFHSSPDGSYSGGSFNSVSASTSNSFVGGYAIRAQNMGLSTSMTNGVVKLTFNTRGPIDSFEKKVVGNEIQFRVMSRGQQKFAKILVPKGISMENVQVDRSADAIYVTAPAASGGAGNMQIFQSSSSDSGSGFNQHWSSSSGSGGIGQLPPLPQMPVMPDPSNMLGNMFNNFFSTMFGGPGGPGGLGARAVPQQRQYRASSPTEFIPGLWFY